MPAAPVPKPRRKASLQSDVAGADDAAPGLLLLPHQLGEVLWRAGLGQRGLATQEGVLQGSTGRTQ
jgi:hypothetical protein